MPDLARSENPAPRARDNAVESAERALSPEAAAALEAGLESARRGEIKRWGDFTQYANDDDE